MNSKRVLIWDTALYLGQHKFCYQTRIAINGISVRAFNWTTLIAHNVNSKKFYANSKEIQH